MGDLNSTPNPKVDRLPTKNIILQKINYSKYSNTITFMIPSVYSTPPPLNLHIPIIIVLAELTKFGLIST